MVKNSPAKQETQETQVQSLGQKDTLKKGMATDSSILAWKIPWTEEPGGPLGCKESFHLMATVNIHSDFGAQENKTGHCFHLFPFYLTRSDGTRCHDLSSLKVEAQASFFTRTLLLHLHEEAL